jgi:hypothetical protein
MIEEPKSLQEAILYFSDPDNCLNYVVARRWPKGVVCPTCGSKDVSFIGTRRLWECKAKHAKRQFSAKIGTIMEDSAMGLDKWLCAMWMIGNCKNGVSSYEVSRDLRVTQKSAWFLLHRIRKAMQDDLSGGMLNGEVEVDETFIGGKARNMHKNRKKRMQITAGRTAGKTVVVGMLERKGRIRATVIPDRSKAVMQESVRGSVAKGAHIISDEWAGNWRIDDEYVHKIVNHLECYVNPRESPKTGQR